MITFLYFYNSWNRYCKRTLDTIKQIENINIIKVNMDEDLEMVSKYRVKGSPTVIIEYNDKIIGKVVGGGPASYYYDIINKINEKV